MNFEEPPISKEQENQLQAEIPERTLESREDFISHESFERQFAAQREIETAGGIAKMVDIVPDRTKEGGVPVFLAQAWGLFSDTYKPTLETITADGERALSLSHPRVGGDMAERTTEEDVNRYTAAELRKALTNLDVLDAAGVDRVDVIAHSEGCMNALIAAKIDPKRRIQNIVLVAPPGLIGDDTFLRLMKGFQGQAQRATTLEAEWPLNPPFENHQGKGNEIPADETERQVAASAAKDAKDYLLKNPFRAVNEVVAMKNADIFAMLHGVHESGVGIVIMAGVDDPVFPMDKMQEFLAHQPEKEKAIDGFLSVRGGHGELGNHPELYTTAALQMLHQLRENKKTNPDVPSPS